MRQTAGEQLVEHDTEAVDVARGADQLSPYLLRAGIVRRHQPHPDLGTLEPMDREIGVEELGDAEIEQLDDAVVGHQDVRRFEVAVHHELTVGMVHAVADHAEEIEALGDGEPAGVGPGIDRLAVDVLHGEIRFTVIGGAAVVELSNVGMVEAGEDLALGEKPAPDFAVVHAGTQHFEGHLTAELVVAHRQGDTRHAAVADVTYYFVGADRLPRFKPDPSRLLRNGPYGGFEERADLALELQLRLDRTAQGLVAAAGLFQHRLAARRFGVENPQQDLFDLEPVLIPHRDLLA